MPTLVINAPAYQAKINSKRSFQNTVGTLVGHDYALNSNIYPQAMKCRRVVVLDKTAKLRAEGKIRRIVPTGARAGNGIPRFDIYMKNLRLCCYSPEALNRNGVAII